MKKISIEKAVELIDMCLCCNTLQEIQKELIKYNKKNNTDYVIQTEYNLYTTSNCSNCILVKKMVESQRLNISIKNVTQDDINYLRKNKITTFPVLEIRAGEKIEFVAGNEVGNYIASNLEMLK